MSMTEFNNVSIIIEANVSYDGRCSSHSVLFEDGSKKMLGIILPNDTEVSSYKFKTNTSERMEIISGNCQVQLKGEKEFSNYRAGQAFMVEGDSSFRLRTDEIVQYVCHLEG